MVKLLKLQIKGNFEDPRVFMESAQTNENPNNSKYLNADFMNTKSKPDIDFKKMLANIKLPVLFVNYTQIERRKIYIFRKFYWKSLFWSF